MGRRSRRGREENAAPRSAANPTGAARPRRAAEPPRGAVRPESGATESAASPSTAEPRPMRGATPEETAAPVASPAAGSAAPADPNAAMKRGYARGRERDERIRASLEPLDGERPGAVTVAAIVAAVLAIANVVAAVVGADVGDQQDATSFTVVSTALLVGAAGGMWRARYWAVLGFQVILTFQIIILSVALIRVEKWWVGLIVLTLIGLGGWLFWKLVRAMARIQMPTR